MQADLVAASEATGRKVSYEPSGAALHDLETGHPFVRFTDASGTAQQIDAVAVAGCYGSFWAEPHRGSRQPARDMGAGLPALWLGILGDVSPSTDELNYAWHPDGFAMHSMRSATVSRLYLPGQLLRGRGTVRRRTAGWLREGPVLGWCCVRAPTPG